MAEHLPGRCGVGHLLLKPGHLAIADQITARIPPGLLHGGEHQFLGDERCQGVGESRDGRCVGGWGNPCFACIAGHQVGVRQNCADPGLHRGRIGILQLLIPGGEPGFEHVQREHIAETEGAIALGEG